MIDWFTYLQIGVSLAAGVFCLVAGFLGKKPGDLSIGSLALVELLLIVQAVISIVMAVTGHGTEGDAIEFVGYLVTALIVPVAAGFWSLVERTKWSTIILGVTSLTIAIMVYRMDQIWFPVAAM